MSTSWCFRLFVSFELPSNNQIPIFLGIMLCTSKMKWGWNLSGKILMTLLSSVPSSAKNSSVSLLAGSCLVDNCSVLHSIFWQSNYPWIVRIRLWGNLLVVGFALPLCSSALILKLFRSFQNAPLFEQILISCISSGIIWFIIILLLSRKGFFSNSQHGVYYWMVIISVLSGMIIGPNTVMNIDRSRSFYILGWVGNHEVHRFTGERFGCTEVGFAHHRSIWWWTGQH